MSEQLSPLARRDTFSMDADSTTRPIRGDRAVAPGRPRSRNAYAPDPFILTISGVLLFVVLVVAVVIRTLYPAVA